MKAVLGDRKAERTWKVVVVPFIVRVRRVSIKVNLFPDDTLSVFHSKGIMDRGPDVVPVQRPCQSDNPFRRAMGIPIVTFEKKGVKEALCNEGKGDVVRDRLQHIVGAILEVFMYHALV